MDSQNMGDVIKSLEREEKDLRRELKKLTPKKGTLAKADHDLSALQAERDELKRQVLLKRECSERLKVNKEIQELKKKELASLDSPQATGGTPKVTIKDLRKMDSLKSVVDSNLEPTLSMMRTTRIHRKKFQKVNLLTKLVKLSLGKLLNHQKFL